MSVHRWMSCIRVSGVLFAAVVGLGLGASVARAVSTPVLSVARPTPVRQYAGYLLFSRWTGSGYALSTIRQGAVRDLPVRRQAKPFDADIGPNSAGRPEVVVSLCDGSCDLYVVGLDAGSRLRPVHNANTRGDDETDPSIWRGRLVFARVYGNDVVPYTKRLLAPRSVSSSRLAALPAKRCGAVDPPDCRPIENAKLERMELWGRWVAQSWTYQPSHFPGFRQNEIRLTTVNRSETRQLAAMTTGLSSQTYLGPSIVDGRVAFYRACQADPGGCNTSASGAIRYRISDGSYQVDTANQAWSSWAFDGAAGYHTPSAFNCAGGDPGSPVTEPCGIYRRAPLAWRSIAEEQLR